MLACDLARMKLASSIPLFALCVTACGGSGSSTGGDWTKLATKRYEATVKGVALSLEMPTGLKGKVGDKKYNHNDYWFMDDTGTLPSVALSVDDRQRPMTEDMVFLAAKSGDGLIHSETLANGYAYTEKDKARRISHVVLNIGDGKSVDCTAIAGSTPVDKKIDEKVPALDKICRSLDVGGITPKSGGAQQARR